MLAKQKDVAYVRHFGEATFQCFTRTGACPVGSSLRWERYPSEFDPCIGLGVSPRGYCSYEQLLHSIYVSHTWNHKGIARRLRNRWISVISRRTRFRSVYSCRSVRARVVCVWRACVEWVCVCMSRYYSCTQMRGTKKTEMQCTPTGLRLRLLVVLVFLDT